MWSLPNTDQSIAVLLFVVLLGSTVEVDRVAAPAPVMPIVIAPPAELERARGEQLRQPTTAPRLLERLPVYRPAAAAAIEAPPEAVGGGTAETAETVSLPTPSATPTAPAPSPASDHAQTQELTEIEDLIRQIEFELDQLASLDPLPEAL